MMPPGSLPPADLPFRWGDQVRRLGRLVRKELFEILRDRRTIITLVLMPLLLYPLLSLAFQQFLLAIRSVQAEVVLRQFCVERQARILQLRGAGLSTGGARADTAPNASPDIHQIRQIERQCISGAGSRSEISSARSDGDCRSRVHNGWVGCDRGEASGTRDSHRIPGSTELCLCRQHVLVGYVHLLFERVEFRITVDLPPLPTGRAVAGLSRLPLVRSGGAGRGRFLVCWRNRCGGPLIFRTHHAGAREQQ